MLFLRALAEIELCTRVSLSVPITVIRFFHTTWNKYTFPLFERWSRLKWIYWVSSKKTYVIWNLLSTTHKILPPAIVQISWIVFLFFFFCFISQFLSKSFWNETLGRFLESVLWLYIINSQNVMKQSISCFFLFIGKDFWFVYCFISFKIIKKKIKS